MLPALRKHASLENPMELFCRDFDILRDDMSRALGRWWSEDDGGVLTAAYPVDIRETDGTLIVDAEVLGFTKEEIEATVENGILNIRAEHKEEKEKKGAHLLQERRYKRVERQLILSVPVNEGKATAKFENGVLHLELAKAAESKAEKIAIA